MTQSVPGDPLTRRDARERAVELAYEADQRGWTAEEILGSLLIDPHPFTVVLLRGAELQRPRAEELISGVARGWTLERMALLDRLIMVLAVAELLTTDTPTAVVLAESVALAGRYSTEESARFVNGVLAAVAREVRTPA